MSTHVGLMRVRSAALTQPCQPMLAPCAFDQPHHWHASSPPHTHYTLCRQPTPLPHRLSTFTMSTSAAHLLPRRLPIRPVRPLLRRQHPLPRRSHHHHIDAMDNCVDLDVSHDTLALQMLNWDVEHYPHAPHRCPPRLPHVR